MVVLPAVSLGGSRTGWTSVSPADAGAAEARGAHHLTRIDCRGKVHFLAIAAGALRRVLVDAARAKQTRKRGGNRHRITRREGEPGPERTLDVLDRDDALQRLALEHPRPCRIVELRYFGGLSLEETAEALGLSRSSVTRGWRLARAWLLRELEGEAELP